MGSQSANDNELVEQRPLHGTRVLDLLTGAMGAIGRQLAELGADVIRVEPEGGAEDRRSGRICHGASIDYAAFNVGKRAAPSGRFDDLVSAADIVLAPRGELDAGELLARRPQLVVLSVSDFGDTEGFHDWSGSEAVYYALSGELSRSGIPERAPLMPPRGLGLACAAMQAAFATIVAYFHALQTGEGDYLDFSMLDGVSQALDPGYGMAGSAAAGVPASKLPRGRLEARHMYPILPCKDGFVRLCVLAPRQWKGMFDWLGRPEEFADPEFEKLQVRFASKTLIPAIVRHFADKTRAELEAEGQGFGVPTAAVLDPAEALETEQIRARGAFKPVEIVPGVSAMLPDGVIEIDGARMGIAGPVPPMPDPAIDWHPREPLARPKLGGNRPLSGLKVLDLGVIIVGAECSRLLADQGADVIKIESSAFPDGARQNITGGHISPAFIAGRRNQRSIGINMRDPKGKDLVHDLIRQSDVLLSNFKGGTLESLGLDYESLKAINPRIIVSDSSAFGPSGPWSTRMGYGPLVRASTGLTMKWRYPGEPDAFSDAMTVYPDHVVGRAVLIGIVSMLIKRVRTGRGGQVSISQAEVILNHIAPDTAADLLAKQGLSVSEGQEVSAIHACAGEDEWCAVTVRNEADEMALHGVAGGQTLSDWFAERDPHEAMSALQAAGVPAGAMLRVAEQPDHAYFAARGFFREVRHPHRDGIQLVEAAPVKAARLPAPPEEPAPLMGEHTVALLQERLGLDSAAIDDLFEAGVIEQFVHEQTETT